MDMNPIATLLGLAPARDKHVLTIAGRGYELYPARGGNAEVLYRTDTGHAMPNPAFTLLYTSPSYRATFLARHLWPNADNKEAALTALDEARRELVVAFGGEG